MKFEKPILLFFLVLLFGSSTAVRKIVVELEEGVDAEEFALRNGLMYEEYLDHLPGNFHVYLQEADPIRSAQNDLRQDGVVLWFEEQIPKQRHRRDIPHPIISNSPQDPLFDNQWYLHPTNYTVGQATITAPHSDLLRTWIQLGFTGYGVVVSVVDDGVLHSHPDFAHCADSNCTMRQTKYIEDLSYDWNDKDSDPSPVSSYDSHGTQVAGCALAISNNICARLFFFEKKVGTAPNAFLSGQRLISGPSDDLMESRALSFQNQKIDIYTNSWGPRDDATRLEGPGRLTQLAMADSVRRGRGGKGSIYIWAGGNGRASQDNCNYDGFANSRFTISVGAITNPDGKAAYYSERCSMLIGVTGSSGGLSGLDTTTYSGGCANNFGGTSGSAPVAAGMAAVILEANPELSWRDLQALLIETCDRVDMADSGWFQNGAGRWFNHNYGFGMLNAFKAAQLAQTWKPLPRYQSLSYVVVSNQPIRDRQTVSSVFHFAPSFVVEHVEVLVYANHTKRGDLEISLASPAGSTSELQTTHKDANVDILWKFGSIVHHGENSRGDWTLTVSDGVENGHSGVLLRWELSLHGHCPIESPNCV